MLQAKLNDDFTYAYILCTDPLLPTLRIAPFTASVLFALIILMIRLRVEMEPNYSAIDEVRKVARLKTIRRLQYITTYFVLNSFYLIAWDLLRYLNNRSLPRAEVNCFGIVENKTFNGILWYCARFFTAQSEMFIIIINFWKKFKGRQRRSRPIMNNVNFSS